MNVLTLIYTIHVCTASVSIYNCKCLFFEKSLHVHLFILHILIHIGRAWYGTWLLLRRWYLQIWSVKWMSLWPIGYHSAQPWDLGNGDGVTSVGCVNSGVVYGMLSYLQWLQVKCLWEDFFSGYRLCFSSSWNDLRCGRRKPATASLTVFILKHYFTASIWGLRGTFAGRHSRVERTGGALVTDCSRFELNLASLKTLWP